MHPIKFEGQNVVFAEDQPEYLPLPAYVENGMATFCMLLSLSELKYAKEKKELQISVLTFGKPVQPIRVDFMRPELPMNVQSEWLINPDKFDGGVATFNIEISEENYYLLRLSRNLWVTTITYGAPLQPIQGSMSPKHINKVKDDIRKAKNRKS